MNMTAYRVSSHRPAVLSAVLCLLVLMLGVACSGSRDRAERNPLDLLTDEFTPQEAVEFIGGPFPSSATSLQVAGEAALDTMVIARFDAPRQDVADWLTGLGITEPLEPGYSPFYSSDPLLPAAESWWSPPATGATTGDFSGVHQQIGPNYFNIVVEETGDGNVTVHLQVFNT